MDLDSKMADVHGVDVSWMAHGPSKGAFYFSIPFQFAGPLHIPNAPLHLCASAAFHHGPKPFPAQTRHHTLIPLLTFKYRRGLYKIVVINILA